jgi:hypothetical protein
MSFLSKNQHKIKNKKLIKTFKIKNNKNKLKSIKIYLRTIKFNRDKNQIEL